MNASGFQGKEYEQQKIKEREEQQRRGREKTRHWNVS
jgi:hypothetical protein